MIRIFISKGRLEFLVATVFVGCGGGLNSEALDDSKDASVISAPSVANENSAVPPRLCQDAVVLPDASENDRVKDPLCDTNNSFLLLVDVLVLAVPPKEGGEGSEGRASDAMVCSGREGRRDGPAGGLFPKEESDVRRVDLLPRGCCCCCCCC